MITFRTLNDGQATVILKDDADLNQFEADAIEAWEFDSRPSNGLTDIRIASFPDELGVSRDTLGRYNPVGYVLARNIGHAIVQCSRVKRGETEYVEPSREFLQDLPLEALQEYYDRAHPAFDLSKVKKKQPDAAPETNTKAQKSASKTD